MFYVEKEKEMSGILSWKQDEFYEKHVIKDVDGNPQFVGIVKDETPMDTRSTEFTDCNIGMLVIPRWQINETNIHDECLNEDTIAEYFGEDAVVLPVYKFEHGEIALQCEPFACRWDSGQVGWIIADEEAIKRVGMVFPEDKDKRREDVERALRSEVESYSHYVNGDVFGYIIFDKDGNNIDSCWGFYGDDHNASNLYAHAGITKETVQEWVMVQKVTLKVKGGKK